jgi:hypothetical protein
MREWRDEVRKSTVLDDASIEALFRNEPVPEEFAAVAGAVGVLRSAAQRPVLPSAELAERMATGDFGDALPEPVPTVPGAHRKPPQLSVRAKVAIGALAGLFGLTVATVAGALPAPLQEGLETLVELVTPVEIDHDVPEQDPPQEEPPGQVVGDVWINEPDKLRADPATPTPDITPGDEPLTSVPPDQVGPVASADPLDTTDTGGASGAEGELGGASDDPTTDPTDEPSLVPEIPGYTTFPGLGLDTPWLLGGGPPGLDGGGPPGLDGGGPPGLEDGLPPGHSGVRQSRVTGSSR